MDIAGGMETSTVPSTGRKARGIFFQFAGGPDTATSSRDFKRLHAKGLIMAAGLGLSCIGWFATAMEHFGRSLMSLTMVIGVLAVQMLLLGAVDHLNALTAIDTAGDRAIGLRQPFAQRVGYRIRTTVRLCIPGFDTLALLALLLPPFFGNDIAQHRSRQHAETVAPILRIAEERTDTRHRELASVAKTAETAATQAATRLEGTQNVERNASAMRQEQIRTLQQALAQRQDAAARHDADYRAEINGLSLRPGHTGRRGLGQRSQEALQLAHEAREEEGRLAMRLAAAGEAHAAARTAAAEAERALERLVLDTAGERDRTAAALRDALAKRDDEVRTRVEADPRYQPLGASGPAEDLETLVAVATSSPGRAFICVVLALWVLVLMLMGPLTAMMPMRLACAAQAAAETSAAITKEFMEAARRHRRAELYADLRE